MDKEYLQEKGLFIMRLLILTTQFPFGYMSEVFFETEFHKLASACETLYILPLKGGVLNRRLPQNVELLEPLAPNGKRSHFWQLLKVKTWLRFSVSLMECYRKTGGVKSVNAIHCLAAACWATAFEGNGRYKSLLRSGSVDIVYAYWAHFPALGIPAAKAAGVHSCVRYHSIDLYAEREENQGFLPGARETWANACLNVFISKHGYEYFAAKAGGVAPGHRMINYLGSSDHGHRSQHTERPDKAGRIVMVSASRIVDVKRVHLIARLAKELAKTRKVEWHHFGGGECPILEKEIANDIPASLEICMHGTVSQECIFKFYGANSVTFFVNLSAFEGVPVSIMEALCADIPVVASHVGATHEAVIDGMSGLLVDSADCEIAEVLAKKIVVALEPGGEIHQSTPRRVWEENFDADANAEKLIARLKELAET